MCRAGIFRVSSGFLFTLHSAGNIGAKKLGFWQSQVQFGQYNSFNCQIRVYSDYNPVCHPVHNPVCNPVRNPVRNPVHNPVRNPVRNQVHNLVHNPVCNMVIGNPYFSQFFALILAHISDDYGPLHMIFNCIT